MYNVQWTIDSCDEYDVQWTSMDNADDGWYPLVMSK